MSSQLVRGRVGGVQPELRRRGADAAGRLCPEEQPDQRRRPGRLWLCPTDTWQEAGLQHSQLSPGMDHGVVVTVLSEVRERPEEEGGDLHEHPAWRQDAHTAGQLVCQPAQTQQSGALLLKTLPEAT